jgi:hypothetical protein
VASSPLTRLSVAQTRSAQHRPEPLSTNFHRRFPGPSSGRAIIESVTTPPPARRSLGPALAGLAGLSLLAAACGGSSSPGVAAVGTTAASATTTAASSAETARQNAALAFARCMRSHGVPDFPDPDPQGDFPPFRTGASKQVSAAANEACKHLLSRGGSTGTPQQRRQKLAFGLKVAQCLRAHGYPDFPDPSGSSQRLPPGINTDSPQFQTAETACEKQERKALGLP